MKNFIKKALLIAFIANLPSFAHVFSMGEKPEEPKLPTTTTYDESTPVREERDLSKKGPAQFSELPKELKISIIIKSSPEELKNLRLINKEWKNIVDKIINNIKEKSENLCSQHPVLEKLDKNVLYNIVKKFFAENYPYTNKVDSYFTNVIETLNEVKTENNKLFKSLDLDAKNLVRALYFLDTNQASFFFVEDDFIEDDETFRKSLTEILNNAKTNKELNLNLFSLPGLTNRTIKPSINIILEIAMIAIPELESLSLQENHLYPKYLPFINFPNLKDLDLSYNNFYGSSTYFSKCNLPRLETLDLVQSPPLPKDEEFKIRNILPRNLKILFEQPYSNAFSCWDF